jgi:hypothetical protein
MLRTGYLMHILISMSYLDRVPLSKEFLPQLGSHDDPRQQERVLGVQEPCRANDHQCR